jgi:hypothetical protein
MKQLSWNLPMTNLILVEGIPGSGKTSAARFVCEWLQNHDKQVALFLEGDLSHPADFESVACLSEPEYAELLARFPEQGDFLAHQARQEAGEWFFSYRKIQHEYGAHIPQALFEALAHFEIYDLAAGQHRRLLLQNWQNFAARAATEDLVYIFECCFMQNPITTLLARHNLPRAIVRQHMLALAEAIGPLQPKLIYLARQDVGATLEAVRRERPQGWADFVTRYLTEQAYGKAHGLRGFEGVISFYAIRQAFELDLLNTLPTSSVVISDELDWGARYESLIAFLEERT